MLKLLGSALAITIALAGCGQDDISGTGGMGGGGGEDGIGGDGGSDLPWACTEDGIRGAIQLGGGPHTFACDGPTVVTTTSTIVVDDDVTLDGEGALIVDGNDSHGVFRVNQDVTATLRGMTVTGGAVEFAGGGISNAGDLTLEDCRVTGNRSGDIAAAIYSFSAVDRGRLEVLNSEISNNQGTLGHAIYAAGPVILEGTTVADNVAGGIYCDGTLTIRNSVIRSNTSEGGGGGVFNAGRTSIVRSLIEANEAVAGGGILSVGRLGMFQVTVRDNTADEGGGLYGFDAERWVEEGDLIVNDLGLVDIQASTFADNTARVGGAIYSKSLRMTAWNSTFSGNTATEEGGAFYIGGTTLGASTTTLTHDTIVDNTAPVGSAIAANNESGGETPTVRLSGNIVAGACAAAGSAVLQSQGYNIESPGDSCAATLPSDTTDATSNELALGALTNNGNDTDTHLPGPDSIAVDAIPEELCEEVLPTGDLFDQRATRRPQGPACDIGSVEREP